MELSDIFYTVATLSLLIWTVVFILVVYKIWQLVTIIKQVGQKASFLKEGLKLKFYQGLLSLLRTRKGGEKYE